MAKTWRWPTFTTRTLLIAIALIAVVCALFGRRLFRGQQERIAVAEITRLGGRVSYENRDLLAQEGYLTRWVAALFYEHIGRVTGVSLNGPKVTDADLQHLASLTGLEGLELSQTNVTDAGLKHLKKLPRLRYVNLGGTNLTEAAIRDLREAMPKLYVDR